MYVPLLAVLVAGCLRSEVVSCDDGRTCPAGTLCDDLHGRCILVDQLTSCGDNPDGSVCNIGDLPTGLCRDGICLEPFCGDGFVDPGEECDGQTMPASDCQGVGFYDPGPISCSEACRYNVTACTGRCGDTMINGGEFCDGSPPTGSSCVDLGFDFGSLGCTGFCTPALDACGTIGWSSLGSPALGFTAIWGSSATDVWAGGTAGLFHWNGDEWSPVTTPLGQVNRLWGLAANAVFAIGTNGVYRFDGTSWSKLDTGGRTLGAIHGTAANDLFAVSSGDLVHWNGSAWSVVASTGSIYVPDVFSPAAGEAWLVGIHPQDGKPGLWHWDGTNLSVANVAARGEYYALWGSSASDVYAVGPQGKVVHFDGSTWSTISLATGTHFLAVGGTSASDVYVSGLDVIYHFDGTSWTPTITKGAAWAIWGSDSNNVFAAAEAIRRYRGDAWVYPTAPTGSTLYAVSTSSTGEMIAVGDQGVALVNNGPYWHTTSTHTLQTLRGVWERIAVGDAGTILTWNGSAWTAKSSGTTADLRDVWGASASDVYAVGLGGTMLHYNGTSWSPEPSWSGSDDLVAIAGKGATRWAVGAHPYRWTGSAWTLTEPYSGFGPVNDVFVDDDGAAWLVTSSEVWRYTTSGGWTNMRENLPSTNYRSVHGGGGLVYVVGTSGTLFWSPDSWNTLVLPSELPKLDAVAVSSDGSLAVFAGEDLTVATNKYGLAVRRVGTPSSPVSDAAAVNDHELWGCADGNLVHFDGVVWSMNSLSDMTLPGTPTQCTSVSLDPAGALLVATDVNVLRFSGGTWSSLGGQGGLWHIAGASATDVWAIETFTGVLVHYTGSSWSDALPPGLTNASDVWVGATNDVWVVGHDANNVATAVHWNGSAWAAPATFTTTLSVIAGVEAGHAVAGGSGGLIWHWDSAAWQSRPANVIGVAALAGSSKKDVFAAGDQLSHYDGTSWTPVRTPDQTFFTQLVQTNRSTFGFAQSIGSQGDVIRLYRSTPW